MSDGAEVIRARAGETVPPLAPGHYLISETTAPGEERVRYLGVAGRGYTVMQLTVGSFTSDTFDAVVHANRVPVNYYVNLGQVNDSTFRGYEQDYGDAVYPHLMPNSLSPVDPAFAHHDANWIRWMRRRSKPGSGRWTASGGSAALPRLHGIGDLYTLQLAGRRDEAARLEGAAFGRAGAELVRRALGDQSLGNAEPAVLRQRRRFPQAG